MNNDKTQKKEMCCPYCEGEISEAGFPFCKPCKVDSLKCPACGKKMTRSQKKCPSCGAALKPSAV